MREVRAVKVGALSARRVAGRVEDVRLLRVIIGSPLMEVVRDVERCRVRGRVLEVDDNDLPIALCQYPPCNRKT